MRKSGMFGGALKKLLLLSMVLFPALANAQMVNPVLVHPTINQGMQNGNGLQETCGGSCSTTATVGATCNSIITWPVPFVDLNYNTICTINGGATGQPTIESVVSGSTTGVTVVIQTQAAVVSSITNVCCIGWHI